ncbi:YdcH family protein [Poseidonocella sp. HB161398]|uniref:YdcH family protein n=1 Tax=Poseidonocella sp. HB161398 TaxID=2320855 RepID=UPI0011086617|nr:YdcH family protein [Poseidonocella sp. HB161398]
MSLTMHIEELQKKHRTLSAKVEEAQRSPGVNDHEIVRMKKQKLHLKEEIERLSRA